MIDKETRTAIRTALIVGAICGGVFAWGVCDLYWTVFQ